MVVAYSVETHDLVQQIVASGRVITNSRAHVGSEIVGVVVERRVDEGDHVEAGDILITLRSEELLARVNEARASLEQLRTITRPEAENQVVDARLRQAQAERENARTQALYGNGHVPAEAAEQSEQAEQIARAATERALLQVEALASGGVEEAIRKERLANAEAVLAKTTIRAVASGTVLSREVEPGDLVQPGSVLMEIARDGYRELLVPFDERHLSSLSVGDKAHSIADAYPDRPFAATVSIIAPTIDAARGTVDVRLSIDEEPAFLQPNMTVSVSVETDARTQALVVPNDVLRSVSGTKAEIMRVRNGRAEAVEVDLGLRGMLQSEIVSGVNAGDEVISDRAIAAGQRVRPRREPQPAAAAPIADRESPLINP
ncbi:MAG: efflux RND transporter periplasmic adaptor subunit [Rhodothermales bacterium]|nr:efflux RND transporter periplasmic adaptor subunit [Rhodothermales bacterium]